MPIYIHELNNWPEFRWDKEKLANHLIEVRHRQGRLIGRVEGLGFDLKDEAVLRTITEDVVKSSEIEGEILDPDQVRSSIARRLGMDIGGLMPADRDVEGVVEMMLDATQQYEKSLTPERLFGWHAALFPTGYSRLTKIRVGTWRDDRDGPMRVVSGPMGKERVHYQAPPAEVLGREMQSFLAWFNEDQNQDKVLKAAIAHLWFVTIHPFEDGNGRITRAITDLMFARTEHSSRRCYSMSAQIREERKTYYDILESTQKGNLDITDWLEWFLGCLDRAFDRADVILEDVLRKARFWGQHAGDSFNDRQRKILQLLLGDFKGMLTSSKWAKLGKCSQDTATRDIQDLMQRHILVKNPGGGRSTSYSLKEE